MPAIKTATVTSSLKDGLQRVLKGSVQNVDLIQGPVPEEGSPDDLVAPDRTEGTRIPAGLAIVAHHEHLQRRHQP
jgi:hypothetical protein